MLLGPGEFLLVLDLTFTKKAIDGSIGVADDIDELEKILSESVKGLVPKRIYIETQMIEEE